MIFIRSGIAHGSFLAILLCTSCGSSDSGTTAPGAAGRSTEGEGGQSGGRAGQIGGRGGQSGAEQEQSGDAGNESAGASGEAGAQGGGGDGPGSDGGGGTGGASSDSGGPAAAGSISNGGSPGLNECAWDPESVDKCPACDSNGECAQPGYKYVGSGAVTSSCCGFEWQEQTAPGKYSWSEASAYCASLSLSGRGWRLPKIAELFSLVDLSDESHASPTINLEAFSDTVRESYWSSSPYGDNGQAAWTVSFNDGATQATAVDDTHPQRVRCLR